MKFENNKNLLHLCAIYGSLNCLSFLSEFDITDWNEEDDNHMIPIEYFIENANDKIIDASSEQIFSIYKNNTNLNSSNGKRVINKLGPQFRALLEK